MDNQATHRQLVRVAHLVLEQHASADAGEQLELVKRACGKYHLAFANSGEVARALDSATWQRSPRPKFNSAPRPRGARL